MAWAFVGVGTVATVTTTAHALTLPAGLRAGDLLVAVISSRIASTVSITLPSGWTLVAESKTNNVVAAATTSEASGMMAYIMCGDDPSAIALTFTHPVAPSVAMGRIVAYRGGNVWSPFDVGIGAKTGTSITAISTTGLTTGEANELIVKGVCSGRASALSAHAATNPATSSGANSVQTAAPIVGTWQERQDSNTTTGADTALAIADAIRSAAGATGALTCTSSVSGGHAQVAGAFRIEPIAVPGGSPVQWSTAGSNFYDFVSSSTNSGTVSSTIDVPADTQLVVVGLKSWAAETPYFTNMTFTKGGADTAMTRVMTPDLFNSQRAGIFYLVSPDTGANKSLKFDWSGTNPPGETPLISVTFWKNLDTASPVRSSGASLEALVSSAFPTRTSVLTALTGDLVIGFVGGDDPTFTEGSVDTWYNLDALVQCTIGTAIRHDAAWGIFPPSANLYVGADAATNLQYGVCAAIVVKPKPAATPGTSTITQTGSTQQFSLVSGNSGTVSSTITVPSDADIVVVGVLGRDSVADYFASMTFTKGAADVAMTRVAPSGGSGAQQPAIFYLALPDRGTNKNLKFDWAGAAAPVAGTFPTVSVTFWKGIDTASPVRSSGSQGELAERFTAVTGTLTAQNGDLVVAMVGGYDNFAAEGSIDTWYNLNTVTQWTFSGPHDAAWGSFAPSGNLEVGATKATNIQYGVCAAIVLKPSSGVTGTLDTTDAADTCVGWTGTVAWLGTLDTTDTADTAAFTGTVAWTGILDVRDDADTAAFTGEVAWWAVLLATDPADIAAFTGDVIPIVDGTLFVTDAPDVADFTGDLVPYSFGVLDVTDTADTAAFTGVVEWWAILDATDSPDIAAFTGVVLIPLDGILDATDVADVAAFTGEVISYLVLDATDVADTAAFNGLVLSGVGGVLDATEDADTASFASDIINNMVLDATDNPDIAAFTGTVEVAGTLTTTDPADTAAFTGSITVAVPFVQTTVIG